MTVTEFMAEYHITKTNFYRALKANNINADDLREPDSKHLSNAGMQTLASILREYMTTPPAEEITPDAPEPAQDAVDASIENSVDAVELAILRERVSGLQRENELLQQEVERLRAEANEWKHLFTDMHDAQQRLLEAPKPSLLERIFGRRKGNN